VNLEEFLAKCEKAPDAYKKVNREVMAQAAQRGKRVLEEDAVAAHVPVLVPHRRPGTARYTLSTPKNSLTGAQAHLFYKGAMFYWVQYGTQPHYIIPKSRGSRGQRKKVGQALQLLAVLSGQTEGLGLGAGLSGALYFEKSDRFAAYARHPGEKAKPFWEGSVIRVQEAVGKVYRPVHTRALISAGFGL
jgi:hypothetical protein